MMTAGRSVLYPCFACGSVWQSQSQTHMLALATFGLPPPRQQPLDAVSLKAAAAPRRKESGVIVCVSVPPYQSDEQDKWCEDNNNEGKLCGPEAWTPPGQPTCLSKTCRCADSDDVGVVPGAKSVICNGEDETYVVKNPSPTEGWLTDEWCAQYCEGNDGGCPEEAIEKCKCGPKKEAAAIPPLPGVVPDEEGEKTDKDFLVCVNDRYVAANEASSDLWCAGSCIPDGCPKDAQEACKCDDDAHGEGPAQEGDMREVDYSCLSIDADKTNEWCNSECGEYGDCPSSAKPYCKCGEDAVTDKVLEQAQRATVIRDTKNNEERSRISAKSACEARNRPGEDCDSDGL